MHGCACCPWAAGLQLPNGCLHGAAASWLPMHGIRAGPSLSQLQPRAGTAFLIEHIGMPPCAQTLLPNPLVFIIRMLQLIRDVAQTIFRATDAFVGGILFQQAGVGLLATAVPLTAAASAASQVRK
jgi:hypothetical protein